MERVNRFGTFPEFIYYALYMFSKVKAFIPDNYQISDAISLREGSFVKI